MREEPLLSSYLLGVDTVFFELWGAIARRIWIWFLPRVAYGCPQYDRSSSALLGGDVIMGVLCTHGLLVGKAPLTHHSHILIMYLLI